MIAGVFIIGAIIALVACIIIFIVLNVISFFSLKFISKIIKDFQEDDDE